MSLNWCQFNSEGYFIIENIVNVFSVIECDYVEQAGVYIVVVFGNVIRSNNVGHLFYFIRAYTVGTIHKQIGVIATVLFKTNLVWSQF